MTDAQSSSPFGGDIDLEDTIDLTGWTDTPPHLQGTDEEGVERAPDELNAEIAKFLQPARPEVPTIDNPPSGTVELLWGIERDGRRYRTAVVRELTGADEEAMARLGSNSANFNVMIVDLHLRRAVVQIGDVLIDKNPEALGELLISDRDLLFKEILLTTYGSTRDYESVPCPTCGFEMDLHVDIEGLIQVTNDRTFDSDTFVVKLRDGEQVLMRYANGKDQLSVFSSPTRALTNPEANSAFIAACVEKVDGKPVADPQTWARDLGVLDRAKIVKALLDIPAIGFKEVEVPCEKCGVKLPTVFGWADLLPR